MRLLKNSKDINIAQKLISAIFIVAISIFSTISLPTASLAQDDPIESQRESELEQFLLLDVPEITDNPNFTLVFTDPSDEGVFIKIDGGNEKRIESPYVLPTLAIGDHKLVFRFTDKEEAEQILEQIIVIIPRAPVIKAPEIADQGTITINGTALPSSTVKLHMTGAAKSYTENISVDQEGAWEHVFKEDFDDGIYSITAITLKNGYSSDFAEDIVFKISTSENESGAITTVGEDIQFTFKDLLNGNPSDLWQNSRDLIYFTAGLFVIFTIIGFFFGRIELGKKDRKSERQFMKLLNGTLGSDSKDKKDRKKKELKAALEKESSGSIKDKLQKLAKKEEENDEEKDKTKEEKEEDEVEQNNHEEGEEKEKMDESEKKSEAKKDKSDADNTIEQDEKDEKADEEGEEQDSVDKTDKVDETDKKDESDTEKELTKEEFLEKYKDHDPDDDNGEEKDVEEDDKKEKDGQDTETEEKNKTAKSKKKTKKDSKGKKKDRNIKITLTTDSLK